MCCEGTAGEWLLYNTASGRFAVADQQGHEAFEAAEGEGAAELYAAGFLVDDDADERAPLEQAFYEQYADTSQLTLVIAPTYACNCRCAYCYEQDKLAAKNAMSAQVEQAVYRFVEACYERDAFTQLSVQWYGGDPSLCLGLVERMSQWFIAFCRQRGVAYDAMMLTNANLIGPEEAALLARCKVGSVLVTIDGPEAVHNLRRPAVGVENPFQRIVTALRALQEQGVRFEVMSNLDKVNAPLLPELQEQLAEALGTPVPVTPAKLNDYAHTYGCGAFAAPNFDLFTHEEYAHACCAMTLDAHPSRGHLRALLAPAPNFCRGQLSRYFVIDAHGDVYKCDGWMGDASRVLFNLLEGDEPVLDAITFDPLANGECRDCALLPQCWGNCSWERELCGWPCHPLKHTLPSYLKALRAHYGPATGPVTVLI